MLKLAYYPAFANDAALTDRYWRAVHFLGPVAEGIESLAMAGGGTIGPPPVYFDPTLADRAAAIDGRLERPASPPIADADVVIVWDQRRSRDAALRGVKRIVTLDPAALHEGDLSIEFGASLAPATAGDVARRRLLSALQRDAQPIAHVFGSGPSLASIDVPSLSAGVGVVCNSIVKDEALMSAIKPRFITAIDPIFHAGPSRHAGVFRAALARALERSDAWFVTQERDAYLYESILPVGVRGRIIAIPTRYALRPNLRLADHFWLTATRNVLTLAMLPLAAALATDIRIYGCDGRSARERGHFWGYAANARFDEELLQQAAAHPGFFTLDYQDYYALHCETVRQWIRAIERGGGQVGVGTPSYIPALAARRMDGVAISEAAPLGFELAARAAYLRRSAQSIYGALLANDAAPAWLKTGLRAAVRASREIAA